MDQLDRHNSKLNQTKCRFSTSSICGAYYRPKWNSVAQETVDEVLNFAISVHKGFASIHWNDQLFRGSYTASRNRTPNVTGSETEFNSREHKVLKWTQERKEQFERVKSIVKTLYRNCIF